MKNSTEILNEDEVVRKELKKCIHVTVDRLLHRLRTMSPLSHEKVQEQTSINSGMVWRIENSRNYRILSYVHLFYVHMQALGCNLYILTLCRTIIHALQTGKCLVITTVDHSELEQYDKHQILLSQHPDDEELKRRKNRRKAILKISAKLGQNMEKNGTKKRVANKKKPGKK